MRLFGFHVAGQEVLTVFVHGDCTRARSQSWGHTTCTKRKTALLPPGLHLNLFVYVLYLPLHLYPNFRSIPTLHLHVSLSCTQAPRGIAMISNGSILCLSFSRSSPLILVYIFPHTPSLTLFLKLPFSSLHPLSPCPVPSPLFHPPLSFPQVVIGNKSLE